MSSPLPRAPGAPAPIGAPWFVQFWPVFIALLMAVSIAASLATVVIAYRHADVDVRVAPETGAAKPMASDREERGLLR